MNSCSKCRFWNGSDPAEYGTCRRYPQFVEHHGREECGEFKPKEVPLSAQLSYNFWYKATCQTCGAVNEAAEDSSEGWYFYKSMPSAAVTFTCPKCPQLPGAKLAYERQ